MSIYVLEKPFYILKRTYCAAVLTENGFMDSEVSLSFLESEEGKKAIVALHLEGIINYLDGKR
jgi:N-acetylmuramoyl-L-alanine amidase